MIGAGNLATNLAKALHSAGHDIIEVYSRTRVSADALAMQVEALPTDNIETLGRDADIYILALKDSVLADIIPSLCSGRNDAVFVHTAGSVSIDIFKGHAVRYGVLYPMQTFSKSRIENIYLTHKLPCIIPKHIGTLLKLVQLFYNGNRYNKVVLLEIINRPAVVQDNIGIQHKNLRQPRLAGLYVYLRVCLLVRLLTHS